MIWCWADDIFCVPSRGYEYGRGTAQSHFIDAEYKIPGRGLVGDAPWGVVDGWRRPKPEFWITKKLQSPIRIDESRALSETSDGVVRVPVENQYDFTNLSELKSTFSFGDVKGTVTADVPARSKGSIAIGGLPRIQGRMWLELRFETKQGRLVDAFRVPVGTVAGMALRVPKPVPLKVRNESWLAGDSARITGDRFEMVFDRDQGYLRRCVAGSQPLLIAFPAIHLLPTNSPTSPIPESVRWKCSGVKVTPVGENVQVELTGSYPQFEGGYTFLIKPKGEVEAKYSFKYTGENTLAREIGWSLDLAPECQTLEWDRTGEWNVYPSDHIGRPHGIAAAGFGVEQKVGMGPWSGDMSPMGSNDFRSTKRNINWADLRTPSGPGVRVVSEGKHSARAMVQPDRTSLYINDWYGGTNVGWGEWVTNYGRGKEVKKGDVIESTLTFRLHH
jgi:hypothetical protein